MPRPRSQPPKDDSNDVDSIDRQHARTCLAAVLRASRLFAANHKDAARLVVEWHDSASRSSDVGGKRGLGQTCIAEICHAATELLERANANTDIVDVFNERITQFIAQHYRTLFPHRLLSASSLLVAWQLPSINQIVGGPENVRWGFADELDTPLPWMQVYGDFQTTRTSALVDGGSQFETIAGTWDEACTLAELLDKAFPVTYRRGHSEVTIERDNGDICEDDFSGWKLCRCILGVNVRVSA